MSSVENNNTSKYRCIQCNICYKDKSGLWYHNKRKHNTNTSNIPQNSNIQCQKSTLNTQTNLTNIQQHIELQCNYCKKIFSRNDNLKRHHLTCKIKNKKETENNVLLEQLKILTQKIEQLEKNINKPQTVNNFNGPVNNNTINVCNVGEVTTKR